MKRLFLFLYLSFLCIAQDCTITIKPLWQNLESDITKNEQFGGKWILVGSLTFKKKSYAKVCMKELDLQWHGSYLETLHATLYKKESEKQFIPLQEHVVCDGQWNKKNQTLVLRFDHEESLSAVSTYYLVLTIPETIESHLKNGCFSICDQNLPEPIKAATMQNNRLYLAAK